MYKVYGNVLSTGTKERTIEVLGGFGHSRTYVLYPVYTRMTRRNFMACAVGPME